MFEENYAEARSLKNNWTSLASTVGCIYVQVTDKELVVRPHKFIGWLINASDLDLKQHIDRSRITKVEKKGKAFPCYHEVSITHLDDAGEAHELLVGVRHEKEFLEALGQKMRNG